jgi:hypothetical protein
MWPGFTYSTTVRGLAVDKSYKREDSNRTGCHRFVCHSYAG